jgi:hypothetical protein
MTSAPDLRRRRWLRTSLGLLASAAAGPAPPVFADSASGLAFNEIYRSEGVLGLELSAKSKALSGKPVRMLGYMAPPLKPDVRFFVLTRAPVALCPFCNSDADWPSDIVVVYPRERSGWSQDGLPVAVTGTLELGSRVDSETGFVSLVRVSDAIVVTLK